MLGSASQYSFSVQIYSMTQWVIILFLVDYLLGPYSTYREQDTKPRSVPVRVFVVVVVFVAAGLLYYSVERINEESAPVPDRV